MKKGWTCIFCLLLTLLGCLCAHAQLQVSAQIDTPAKAIYADHLDYIYVQTQRDELLKYNAKGELKWRYSNNRFGRLTSVDVSDPLRVILFFADFQQVLVLNNNLNEIASFSFAKDENMLVSAVASGNNNSLWAFDQNSNCLFKMSSNFVEVARSANLFQLFDEVISARKLVASDQFVYLQTSDRTVLQFDAFGAYIKNLPIDSLSDFNITSNQIAYLQNRMVKFFDLSKSTATQQMLPLKQKPLQVAVGNKIIAALTEKAVFLFSGN